MKSFEQPDEDPEVKPPKWIGAIAEPPPHPLSSLVLRTSNICKTKRIISWILRFIHNRFHQGAEKRCSPFPLISEMRKAEVILIQIAQRECYRKEFRRLEKGKDLKPDSSLITLTPFIDSEAKLIRVGGCLGYCSFPKDIKHPILLPPLHQVTKAITQREHLLLRHASAERTLVVVHRKYWIPRGRASVNNIIKDCFDCKRFRAKPNIPLMSPLPTHRLQDDRPAFSKHRNRLFRTNLDNSRPMHREEMGNYIHLSSDSSCTFRNGLLLGHCLIPLSFLEILSPKNKTRCGLFRQSHQSYRRREGAKGRLGAP
jgi:hypothetical protein